MLYYPYHGKILTILPTWVCLRDSCAPQTSLRRKPSPKALPHKALGGQDHYLHFPVRGRKLKSIGHMGRTCIYHYLHVPVRGRKPDPSPCFVRTVDDHYLHFPVRGRKLGAALPSIHFQQDHYLHFPVRGRKRLHHAHDALNVGIIIYISP